ncbi:hypothetical protein OZX68_00500 [Streptococcaceae bacterium ESL0729]|nr:hypothetical protein OZX68_00500 [Streptococcaceae bacterium ESL0729]
MNYQETQSDGRLYFDQTTVFIIGYVIWLFSFLIVKTELLNIFIFIDNFSKLRYLGLGIIVLSTFMNDRLYIYKYLTLFPIVAFYMANNYFRAGETYFLDVSILILFSVNLDLKKFLKYHLLFFTIFHVAIIMMSLVGILPDIVTYRDNDIRHQLGFQWSTFSVQGLLYIIAGLMVYFREKISFWVIILLEIINIYLYKMTSTRSPFIIITLFLLLYLVVKYFKIDLTKIKLYKLLFLLAIPILTFSIYYFSKNALAYPTLDKLSSNRLWLGYKALSNYNIKLFGQRTSLVPIQNVVGAEYTFVDSSYLQYLLKFGIVSYILFFSSLFILQVKSLVCRNSYFSMAILLILVNGLLDPQVLDPFYNFLIIFMGHMIGKNSSIFGVEEENYGIDKNLLAR